jgi:hypothetical protein
VPIRWPGRVAALVWLDLRQAVPMCLAGLVLACLFVASEVVSIAGIDSRLPQRIVGQLSGGTWIVALLWAAVVGSGVFASDLGPRLEQFWRSRPISPSVWFWVKFLAGLAAVLGVLDGVPILIGWDSPYAEGSNIMSRAYVACMPLLHALLYALAVLGTCWLRRPVVAAMAALLLFFTLSFILGSVPGGAEFEPIQVYNAVFDEEDFESGGALSQRSHGAPRAWVGSPEDHLVRHAQVSRRYAVVYGGMAAVIVFASLAAWRGALRPSAFGRRARA